jgi:hypothetical protein
MSVGVCVWVGGIVVNKKRAVHEQLVQRIKWRKCIDLCQEHVSGKTLSLTSIEYLLAHVHVESTERVVHDHNVATRIHRTSDGDSLSLPPREVDPTLANHRLIAVGEKV